MLKGVKAKMSKMLVKLKVSKKIKQGKYVTK